MSEYTPSDAAYDRGAQAVRDYLQHPLVADVKWSPETTTGVVIDYVAPVIAAEVREQAAARIEAQEADLGPILDAFAECARWEQTGAEMAHTIISAIVTDLRRGEDE